MSDPFPDEVDEALWDEACRRADAIREFLKSRTGKMSVAEVALLAAELEISQATAYRLIKLFRVGGTVMSLVERKPGRPEGHRVLDDRREEIIRTTISRYYLTRNRPSVSQLVRDVQTNCLSVGLRRPHPRTIKARLEDIDLQKRAKRRGEAKVAKNTRAVPGMLAASRPLQIVQVDHTKADIFVVDEETRQPIGRPWLTLAMDVCSRMVTGFYLTMDGRFDYIGHGGCSWTSELAGVGLGQARTSRSGRL